MKTRVFARAAAMVAAALRTLTAVAATAAIVGGGLTLISNGVVSAHTPQVSADCDGVHVNLTNYEGPAGNNTVTVTIDGVPFVDQFGTSFDATYPVPQNGATLVWTVFVDANLNSGDPDKYDYFKDGLVGPCGEPPVDLCPNLDEAQSEIPAGYVIDENGDCVIPPPPPNCDTSVVVGSVENWVATNGFNTNECFAISVTPECGVVNGSVTKQPQPQYATPFYLRWDEGGSIVDPGSASNFPATFAEDYNGGSVDITYYIAGPESGWVSGSGHPNFWDGNGVTITVDTDCEESTTTTTTTVEETTTTTVPRTPTNEPTIDITALTPVCQNGAPYIHATVDGSAELTGRTATIEFIDSNGDVVETHTRTFEPGVLMSFIYPGASVDSNGDPTDWPGWSFDGTNWVLDPSDDHLRDGLTVRISINPTAEGRVEYPAATEDCSDPQIVEVSPLSPTPEAPAPEAPTPEAPEQQLSGTLPATGTNTVLIAGIAAALAALGGAAIVIGRRRTIDA